MAFLVLLLILAAGVLGFGAVVYGSVVKNRWGIHASRVACPQCGLLQPRFRVPASVSEAAWGGSTCPRCGTRMDKWGRVRTPVS